MPVVKITRAMLKQFLSISSTYYPFAPFTKLSEENSPEIDDTAFVGDKNGSPSITGYKNKWTFEAQAHEGDPIVDDFIAIARGQKVGVDCERQLVDVDLNKELSTGVYYARRAKVAVECTPPAGDPKSITKISGALHQIGDLEEGAFTLATKTFVADTDPTKYAVTMTVVPAAASVVLRDSDNVQIPVTVNDVTGVVTIPTLAAGTYEYSVFADGYITTVDTFTVASSAVAVGTVTITEPV